MSEGGMTRGDGQRVCPRCGGQKAAQAWECGRCANVRRRARRYAEAVMDGRRLRLGFENAVEVLVR